MKRALINRNLIVLLPKQPALDWILRVDPEPMPPYSTRRLGRSVIGVTVCEGRPPGGVG